MTHKLILLDDHSLLRNGIKNWIESNSNYKVEYEAGTYSDFLKIKEHFYHKNSLLPNDFIAIVDISFKKESIDIQSNFMEINANTANYGFEIIKQLSAIGIPCIVFSSHDSGGFIEKAISIEIGAKGYVSKNSDETTLLAAIKSVSSGGTYIQPELVTNLLNVRDITQTFTKKEKEVANLITLSTSNLEIATTLGITEKTVLNYLTIIYDKAGVQNKLQFLERMGRL